MYTASVFFKKKISWHLTLNIYILCHKKNKISNKQKRNNMARKQIPQKGTKEYHHYQRKLDSNYKEALGRLRYILKGLKPIAKKMAVHHNVDSKPIRDLIMIQSNHMKFKQFCDLHSNERKINSLAKKVNLYLSFNKTKSEILSIEPGYVSFEGNNILLEDLVQAIKDLLIYQDSVITKKEIDPKFTTKHKNFHFIVNNVRTSIIYAYENIVLLYEKETKPARRFSLKFSKKKR